MGEDGMYVEVTAYFQVAGERVAESDPQRVSIGAALHPAKMFPMLPDEKATESALMAGRAARFEFGESGA